MTDPDSWGGRLQSARRAAGYSSAAKFATRVGVTERAIRRWENNKVMPKPENRAALAAVSATIKSLVGEIPVEEKRRADLAQRMSQLERETAAHHQRQEQETAALWEAVEQLRAERENPGRKRAGGQSS